MHLLLLGDALNLLLMSFQGFSETLRSLIEVGLGQLQAVQNVVRVVSVSSA